MKFVEQSGSMRHTASYGYDLLNNLTTMTETFNGEKRTTGYTYDDDNRVTSVETAAGTEFYTYDVYGRVSQIVTKKGGVVILTKSYTYQGDGSNKPTARVNTMTVTGGGYNKTYQYYYDKNDNLISVSDDTHSTSYYYDSANQLIRENNQAGNLTKGWTYDNAGNILYSREYPYATGTVGTPEETNNYTYGDTNWGDKLTAYNGQTITYDAIGNPLSDGTWSYTWEHGREMASMSKNSALTITQQPVDCLTSLGGTATFTVSASGTGLSCRWQYSDDAGKTWRNSTNSTAIYGTIQITGLTQDLMNLLWRCIVTDGTGHTAVSQVARCRTATNGLRITTQPNNVYCAIGDSASLTVVAAGEGLHCQWEYSPDGGKTWHNSTNGTATYATLYMSEVNEYLMGMAWRCKVMDGSGHTTYTRAVYLKRNTTLWTNTYNSDGLRVSRTNRESTYNYTYLSGQLTHLTVDGHTMYFYYGADGTPMALSFNGVRYYYVTSLQGDVIAIVDQNGTVVTTYLYDAWGNHLHTTGSLSATVGRYNPLRYRGYVYDRETGLYYLQSRYYNPETGRFINADGLSTTGQSVIGNNMFTYCSNNPSNLTVSQISTVQNAEFGYTAATPLPVEANACIKFDVPLYNQGTYSLCWAFSQVMVMDYRAGISVTNEEATAKAINISKEINGPNEEDWNVAGYPQNMGENYLYDININELYDALIQYGPLYGYYSGNSGAHYIVVTGVDLMYGTIYTNNPWEIYGIQTVSQFSNGFAGMPNNWHMPYTFCAPAK